jgi:hypothetical protein
LKNGFMAWAARLLLPLACYCSAASAECSLKIQSRIGSGWKKEGVTYTVEKNTVRIKVSGGGKQDTDSISIGSIRGCAALTINVSQISGQYPWGGKSIGFSFANAPLEPHQWANHASFPPPSGRAIEDGFIKAGLSNNSRLVYDIDDSSKTVHFGAKVFIGANNSLELQFDAQETSVERQGNARQSFRSPKRYPSRMGHEPDNAVASCSLTCHAPRATQGEIAIPPLAACPGEHD